MLVKLRRLLPIIAAVALSAPTLAASNVNRRVDHTKAYQKRTDVGPNINIKVTPPEKRGEKGKVLVEVYNFSQVYLSLVSFELILQNSWGDTITAEVSADDLKQNWSGLQWIQIPGKGKIEKITAVKIKNLRLYDQTSKEVKVPYTIDLIKE